MLNGVILNPVLEFIIQNHKVLEADDLLEVHHPDNENPRSINKIPQHFRRKLAFHTELHYFFTDFEIISSVVGFIIWGFYN